MNLSLLILHSNASIFHPMSVQDLSLTVLLIMYTLCDTELEREPALLALTITAAVLCVATVILYFLTIKFIYAHRRLEGMKINKYKVIVMLGLYPVRSYLLFVIFFTLLLHYNPKQCSAVLLFNVHVLEINTSCSLSEL